MRQRILTALIALTVVTSGVAGLTAAETGSDTELAQQAAGASVSFANQTTGGDTVTVESVRLPEGGYVTIHDASVSDGNVLDSVAGTSAYLEPGPHENVTISLTDDVSDGSYVAMAHQETDGDRTYEFVASNGQTDGPYTADGGPVVDSATVSVSATVSMSDQPTDGDSVVVDRVVLSEGGFVTVHDASVTDGAVFESIRGTSAYLGAGVHEDVRVQLDTPVEENTTLVPMAHRDTDGDRAYTFPESEGSTDGPYTADGDAVVDTAAATLSDTAMANMTDQVSGGNAVTVDSVYLPEGGFVTIHDATVAEGDVFDSVRGTSTYLEPGYHTDVSVALDDPVTDDATLVAMPHMDTDDDQTYDFVTSEGADDGPYTADDEAVTDSGAVTISAAVSVADQSSDGTTVVIDRVDVSEGGFVAIHDATLFDGAVVDSVVGHSEYLEPGVHENVEVTLDERLTSGQTLVAMPHLDTDGDEAYTFDESEGGADGPYTANGSAVVDTSELTVEASLAFEDQTTDGETVTVDAVTLQDGGFVTIHDGSVTEGDVFESIRGTSAYLEPGTHENVTVTLSEPVSETTTLVPMAHRDTDGDEAYTFPESDGSADGPYLAGGAVVATGVLDVEGMDQMTEEEMMTETETATETTGDSGPGFTAVLGVVAILAAALLAARREA